MTCWDPFAELGELRARFDRMFVELTDGHSHGRMPAIDVVRDNGNLVVRANIPGIKPGDGVLRRSLALPVGVDANHVKAKTQDGVVEVTIPLPTETKNKETITTTPTAA